MDQFVTAAYLATMAGQASIVLMFTQVIRNAAPALDTYYLRMSVFALALIVHGVMISWRVGMTLPEYLMFVVDSFTVALVAMKTAEFVKGASSEPQPGGHDAAPKA
jgi:hypothetical protein